MTFTVLSFVGILFGLLIVGIPVGFAIGLASLILLNIESGGTADPTIITQRLFSGVDSFPLLAVPLFMFTGNLMNIGGISKRIFDFATHLVGHMRLGLGQVNVVASMIFAGMSGAAVADASGLGPIEIKAMLDADYDPGYSAAITAASSAIGPIIPPSIPLVIYGIMAEASIGRLLLGGILPGVLIGILLMLMNEFYFARKLGYERGQFAGWRPLWQSFRRAFWPLMTPVILVGGILSGIFTPTEAAAVALVYAIALSVVYQEVTLGELLALSQETMRSTAEVLIIVGAAGAFAYMVVSAQLPQMILRTVSSLTMNRWAVLALINLFLLIIGCFMEPVAAITITVPVMMPLVRQLGIDPIHFGLVVVFNLVLGLLTPPVGLVLFVTAKIAGLTVEELIWNILPFFIPLLLGLLIITYVPSIVTIIPDLLMG
ncbi:MAG: TRAP transporter large permease [Limnochordia bacterium]|jgi:tripartite ATP-independent transporter DctM subunit